MSVGWITDSPNKWWVTLKYKNNSTIYGTIYLPTQLRLWTLRKTVRSSCTRQFYWSVISAWIATKIRQFYAREKILYYKSSVGSLLHTSVTKNWKKFYTQLWFRPATKMRDLWLLWIRKWVLLYWLTIFRWIWRRSCQRLLRRNATTWVWVVYQLLRGRPRIAVHQYLALTAHNAPFSLTLPKVAVLFCLSTWGFQRRPGRMQLLIILRSSSDWVI